MDKINNLELKIEKIQKKIEDLQFKEEKKRLKKIENDKYIVNIEQIDEELKNQEVLRYDIKYYRCNSCSYNCVKRTDMARHNRTKKHLKNKSNTTSSS